MKLSVVLATFNEERNLRRCLESVSDLADEIVVVDGESTDKTRLIAKRFGARVFVEKNRPIFHVNKQIALEKARGQWVLQLDADEVVDRELARSVKAAITTSNGTDGYFLKRKNFFLGTWLQKGGQYPDAVIRLVKKGKAHFPQKSVHEQIEVEGTVGILKGHVLHYTAPSFRRYLENSNRYTSLTAAELQSAHVSLNLFNWLKYLAFKPFETFTMLYFRHKGFMDGFPGFIFALFSGLHWPAAFLKYWEIRRVKQEKA